MTKSADGTWFVHTIKGGPVYVPDHSVYDETGEAVSIEYLKPFLVPRGMEETFRGMPYTLELTDDKLPADWEKMAAAKYKAWEDHERNDKMEAGRGTPVNIYNEDRTWKPHPKRPLFTYPKGGKPTAEPAKPSTKTTKKDGD